RDRYSFQRFLGLTPEGVVPDAKTVWVFREELKRHGLIDKLYCQLNHQIESAGYVPRKGQIIDASIVEAVAIAAERGLQLPIVWNCGGYESLPVIRALEGIVDIYMPDIKFFDNDSSTRYMDAPNYPKVARKVLKEMHRQVGPLELDQRGIARRGVLIRHLVMPDHKEDTAAILKFIAGELSPDSYVNIMEQYNPAWRSHEFEEINRRITHAEWEEARNMARELGLSRGF
ncbi:MAG: transposase, partial [Nitrospinota bacterium]|nr:transposase [Nitrospinota bacterium]